MSLAERVRRRFTRPPELVRAVVLASTDPDERVLAWGGLVRDEGWLVATSRGLRRVPAEARPLLCPGAAPAGILHIGVGAFHRAHQAVYTEAAMAADETALEIAADELPPAAPPSDGDGRRERDPEY